MLSSFNWRRTDWFLYAGTCRYLMTGRIIARLSYERLDEYSKSTYKLQYKYYKQVRHKHAYEIDFRRQQCPFYCTSIEPATLKCTSLKINGSGGTPLEGQKGSCRQVGIFQLNRNYGDLTNDDVSSDYHFRFQSDPFSPDTLIYNLNNTFPLTQICMTLAYLQHSQTQFHIRRQTTESVNI